MQIFNPTHRGQQALAPKFINEGKTTGGVPNTYAQGLTAANRVGSRAPVFDAREPDQPSSDDDLIDCLRNELQESEDKVIELEGELAERDLTIKRLQGQIKRQGNLRG